jgi:peptidoglycan/xylan/chitin deacetylase (PgdA/CDA1 family)
MGTLAFLIAVAASFPSPSQLPTMPRLIQGAQPVYCAGTQGRRFALTFDDGPSPYTPRLVRVLRRAHARATFFDVGNRVDIWPEGALASGSVGELGNHTWSHAHLTSLSPRDAWSELVSAQRVLARLPGSAPHLFRPPYAEAEPLDDRLARRLDLLDIRWSVDTGDSRVGATPKRVIRAAVAGLRPGAIVLLHDPHPWTARVAAVVLRAARRKNLEPVTVTELLVRQPPSVLQLGSLGAGRCPG